MTQPKPGRPINVDPMNVIIRLRTELNEVRYSSVLLEVAVAERDDRIQALEARVAELEGDGATETDTEAPS